jgi:DNA-binding transcriptional LysR family regulator
MWNHHPRLETIVLDLNDLQVFVKVVDHGGFSAASRALGQPKQTLSKRLAALEKATGVRLVHRTSRSFAVTELGRDLYRHATAMLIEAEAAEAVIRGRLAEPSGLVRITASVITVQLFLANLLPGLARMYPRIRIALTATDRFVDVVQEGYDIALRDHLGPLPDSGLMQRRVGVEQFWLVATPNYLADRKLPIEPSDLNEYEGIFTQPGDSGWDLTHQDGRTARVAPEPRYYANEGAGLLAAARAGLGIANLPTSLCGAAVRQRELVRLLPGWISGTVTTTLLTPHRRGLLPSVRVVADAIVDQLFTGMEAVAAADL